MNVTENVFKKAIGDEDDDDDDYYEDDDNGVSDDHRKICNFS